MPCFMCTSLITLAKALSSSSGVVKVIVKFVCPMLKLYDDFLCDRVAELMGPSVSYILWNGKRGAADICFISLEHCDTRAYPDDGRPLLPLTAKHLEIPSENKDQGNSIAEALRPISGNSDHQANILWLSDVHVDFHYYPNTYVSCAGEPICCRSHSKRGSSDNRAGKWGSSDDVYCDIPPKTFADLLRHVCKSNGIRSAARHDPNTRSPYSLPIDFILFTGDLPPHDLWLENVDSVYNSINFMIDAIEQYFPNTTIIFAIGNHEATPVNL